MFLAVGACFGLGKYLDVASRLKDSSVQILAGMPAEHGITPTNVSVKLGEKVVLRLTSKDTAYAFLLPEFGIEATPVEPGVFTIVEFVPDKAGTFLFYYNALDPDNPLSQSGTMVVEP